MQQKQNIKGFTLLELLVILAIIGVVSGLSFPKFSKWSMDREVRSLNERIATLFTLATTQVERGAYHYVRVEFQENKIITVKGLSANIFSDKLNAGKPPKCEATDMDTSDLITSLTLSDKVNVYHLKKNAAICFSKGGKYHKQYLTANTQNNIALDNNLTTTNKIVVLCHVRIVSCNPISKTFSPKLKEYPVYLVSYSRFGIINKYKYSYSKNAWINQ